MSYTLYHAPQTRSSQILWLAEELGAPYQIHKIDINTGDGKDGGFQAASPFGKVPAIRDGNTAINETGAIALYLADKYGLGTLAPKHDAANRGDYYRWVLTAAASLDVALINTMTKREEFPRGQASLKAITDFIITTLHKHPYVAGENFTAADVMVAAGLGWGMFMKAIPSDNATLAGYVERTTSRPARKRALEIDAKLKGG
jgi:glutathione S-transferase